MPAPETQPKPKPKPKPKQDGPPPLDPRRALQRTATLLKQAADPTRIRILTALAGGEQHVGALCTGLGQSQPAVSHHLALLRHGGLIQPRRQGKNNFYGLTDAGAQLAAVAGGLAASL